MAAWAYVEAFSPVGAARQRSRKLSRQSAWRHPLSSLATANGGTPFSLVLLAGSS